MTLPPPHRFSVAPMMDWTDRHCRTLHRALTRHALLYTEMVTADAILHGDQERHLGFDPAEQPLALQLGGADPTKLATAARIGADRGYREINLNVGCPSDRVQNGAFGACLMRQPQLVAECLSAMKAAVPSDVAVTIKHRLGVDDDHPADTLLPFIETVASSGCKVFVIHARKAILSGLSPKQNREIPPLDYNLVHQVKAAHPTLTIVLNGGLATLADAAQAIAPCSRNPHGLDGVMLGRAAYHNPGLLAAVDRTFYGSTEAEISVDQAALAFRAHIRTAMTQGTPFYAMIRHALGLFQGRPGARRFRQILTEHGVRVGRDVDSGLTCWDTAIQALVPGPAPETILN